MSYRRTTIGEREYVTVTTPSNANYLFVYYCNINQNNEQEIRESIQIEEGNQATDYIAHQGNSYRVDLGGKNIFDKENANILNGYIDGNTNTIKTNNNARTLYIKCQPNTTYTISKILSARFSICTTSTTPLLDTVSIAQRQLSNTVTNLTITTDANAQYLCVFYYLSSADTVTEQSILDSLQIEKRKYSNTIQSIYCKPYRTM